MDDLNKLVYVVLDDSSKDGTQLNTNNFNFDLSVNSFVKIVLTQDNANVKKISLGEQVAEAQFTFKIEDGSETTYYLTASAKGTIRFQKNTQASEIIITNIKPVASSATKVPLNLDIEACIEPPSKYYYIK